MVVTGFVRLLRYIALKYCSCEHPIVLFYSVNKIIEKAIVGVK